MEFFSAINTHFFTVLRITAIITESKKTTQKFDLITLHQDDPVLFSKVYQKVILEITEEDIKETLFINIDNIYNIDQKNIGNFFVFTKTWK